MWSDLASDGNTRSQSDTNAKWKNGSPPADAGRNCAMPTNDVGETYWCFCRDSHNADWGYCMEPATPGTPVQLNVQVVAPTVAIAAWVTFESAGAEPHPTARLSKFADMRNAQALSGVTRTYTESGSKHRMYSMHFVRLTGLAPRTKYYYDVNSGTGAPSSPVHDFVSLYHGSDGGPTKFAIFGDMGVYTYNNMDNLETDTAVGNIDFLIHLGDHAYNIADDDGYRGDGYMDAFSRVLAHVPWIPVLGNHEYYGDEFHRYTDMVMGGVNQSWPDGRRGVKSMDGSALNAAISLGQAMGPAAHGGVEHGGVPSNTSRYYSVDVGLVHFVALDMNAYYFSTEEQFRQPQLKWLDQDLAAAASNRAAVPWLVVMAHHPMYCSSVTLAADVHQDAAAIVDGKLVSMVDEVDRLGAFNGCTGTGEQTVAETRADLEPLFMKYGVDVFFAGHEHDYESIWPSFNNKIQQKSFVEPKATSHFVTGAGGAPALDAFGSPGPWTRKQLAAWSYGRVTVHNASHFQYDHIINADGSIYDTVMIVQSSHGPFSSIA